MRAETIKGHLDLLLLAVVADKPVHGYAVITELSRRTAGALDLAEGTVYPALHRLEDAGLLASSWDVVAGRRRRIYHLTLAGEAALAEQAAQWRKFSGSMTRVLGASSARARAAMMGGTA